jgi:hypothetical protein
MGCPGNFENPRTYAEKIGFRKLYGNHETYARIADKLAVREYVAERVGSQCLVPLLGSYDRLSPEIFDALPSQCVIKASHGCRWNRIVTDKQAIDRDATVRRFDSRIRATFGGHTGEFHYSLIEPKILIEELLLHEGEIPCDYNLFCYHHAGRFDYAIAIRFPDGRPPLQFDRNWNVLEGELTREDRQRLVAPKCFDEMLSVARALSEGFDFLRVDLYNVNGHVYFGELTCTPSAGLSPVTSAVRDEMRTRMWHLAVEDPHLYRKPRGWRGEGDAGAAGPG